MAEEFDRYFFYDKETIKFLIEESKLKYQELLDQEKTGSFGEILMPQLNYEKEKYQILKLALFACDDNSAISTVDLATHGTLDLNKIYEVKQRSGAELNDHLFESKEFEAPSHRALGDSKSSCVDCSGCASCTDDTRSDRTEVSERTARGKIVLAVVPPNSPRKPKVEFE